jgi:hypothetical membrane protein
VSGVFFCGKHKLQYNLGMNKIQRYVLFVLLYAGLPLFLLSTNPEHLPLLLLWIPFLLLFAILYISARTLAARNNRMKGRRLMSVSIIAAALPVLLLVLSSINQLTLRDTIISITLMLAGIFYLQRLDI